MRALWEAAVGLRQECRPYHEREEEATAKRETKTVRNMATRVAIFVQLRAVLPASSPKPQASKKPFFYGLQCIGWSKLIMCTTVSSCHPLDATILTGRCMGLL